ncbi:MAG TPA: hypothetical protein DER60_08305 [Syntrophomonas sp.]|nr:hypothetical protein [Syntrophomonas sp.]
MIDFDYSIFLASVAALLHLVVTGQIHCIYYATWQFCKGVLSKVRVYRKNISANIYMLVFSNQAVI